MITPATPSTPPAAAAADPAPSPLDRPRQKATQPSVVIASYRQPRELDLALSSLHRQTRAPHEVLIADDGSGSKTRDIIAHWAAKCPFPIHHVWQVDNGYRKARIVNEAVRRSTGDHLIFLDGDTFPHKNWVEDHIAAADGHRVLCGRRVKLGPKLSPLVTRDDIEAGRFDHAFTGLLMKSRLAGDTKRLALGVRLPKQVARMLHPRPRKLMGVNFSLPRAAFVHVNGYDETWTVYGHEDRDLELRLIRAGYPRFPILNRAIVYHLHHDERPKTAKTRELIAAAERAENVQCAIGYAQMERFDPAT